MSEGQKRPLIKGALVIVVFLAAGGAWRALGSKEDVAKTKPARPPVPVSTEIARTQDMPEITRSIGTVRSLHDVVVQTQVQGVLVEVLFREGQRVKKGDLLARIDDRLIAAEVAQARAEKRKNEAQLASARADLGRYNNLLKAEAISRQVLDQQTAMVEQLEATLATNEAAIAAAEVRLSYTRILSPVDGRVGLRRVDPGNIAQPNSPQGLVSVTQLDPIDVMVALPQDLLPVLQPLLRDSPNAPVIALDRPGGTVLGKGHMQMIDNQIDHTTGTILLKTEFPNSEEKLWPGQSVAVEIQTGFNAGALVISAKSVQRGLKGPFVYRVRDGKAEIVQVQVGKENNGQVLIQGGLSPGDVVVSDGHSRVVPGGPVKVIGAPEKERAT